jgi:hypothetical protein
MHCPFYLLCLDCNVSGLHSHIEVCLCFSLSLPPLPQLILFSFDIYLPYFFILNSEVPPRVFQGSTLCECSIEVLCASVLVKCFVRVF